MNEQEIKARIARYKQHQQEQLKLYPLTKVVNLTIKTDEQQQTKSEPN
jgi:hypothetical protein